MKHVHHKYQRARLGKKYVIYRCMLPNCTHYVSEDLLQNRVAICWRCEEPFQITAELATLARPHCKACTKTKKIKRTETFEDAFSKLNLKLEPKDDEESEFYGNH